MPSCAVKGFPCVFPNQILAVTKFFWNVMNEILKQEKWRDWIICLVQEDPRWTLLEKRTPKGRICKMRICGKNISKSEVCGYSAQTYGSSCDEEISPSGGSTTLERCKQDLCKKRFDFCEH